MDPSTPLTVARGTLITSAMTGSLAGIYGVFTRHTHVGPLVVSAAINGGIAGATFFSFREYVVSNLLLSALPTTSYYRRIREAHTRLQTQGNSGEKLTFWDMRAYKVPETAISSAFTGGLLNAWKRGPSGIAPGITTAAIVCTALQLAYNELGIARIKYVSKTLQASQKPHLSETSPSQELSSSKPHKPVAERVLSMLGFHRMSDTEYLDSLKQKRDRYLRRIAELEEERDSEKGQDPPNPPST
ncbi:hypothetical protein SCP_0404910 [Sparassis crispa]|uniref:Uncharacterized protein n=1 Tax=Sparassis crispa TaxID=139825 RepID=A0A401GJ25_9APHY|nr:hypothetical protein SCP_0404910 [Sparassis crispa]GBE82111.1 hypothetical protein SCP_0404910 [Sparassis crispa]